MAWVITFSVNDDEYRCTLLIHGADHVERVYGAPTNVKVDHRYELKFDEKVLKVYETDELTWPYRPKPYKPKREP